MSWIFIFYCIVCIVASVSAWTGSQVTSTTSLTLTSTSAFQSVGLSLTISTSKSTDKVLLTVNINVYASVASQPTTLTIFRGATNLGGTTSLKVLNPQYAAESQPATMSFLDTPGSVGTFVYTVQAMGYGTLSYNSLPRQFAAIIITDNYHSYFASATASVTSPAAALGLSVSAVTTTSTDKVLVLANLDITTTGVNSDSTFSFTRGATSLGTSSILANSKAISATIGVLDTPGPTATYAYSPVLVRATGSVSVVGASAQIRNIAAIVLPAAQAVATSYATQLSITSTTWVTVNVDTSITPINANDQVLLVFTADQISMAATAITACLTIFRNGVNIGDATYGLNVINAGAFQYTRRSPTFIYLDAPASTAAVVYSVRARSVEGLEWELCRDGVQMSLSATLVSTYYETPSLAPTAAPTNPTAKPTLAPTFVPTTKPTGAPTVAPSMSPTKAPSSSPTINPTATPTGAPTATPTGTPTLAPTAQPTTAPTLTPSMNPTVAPTYRPTMAPSGDD